MDTYCLVLFLVIVFYYKQIYFILNEATRTVALDRVVDHNPADALTEMFTKDNGERE